MVTTGMYSVSPVRAYCYIGALGLYHLLLYVLCAKINDDDSDRDHDDRYNRKLNLGTNTVSTNGKSSNRSNYRRTIAEGQTYNDVYANFYEHKIF